MKSVAASVCHHTVLLGGAPFHVAEAGSGELVILLHGFPECWYSWRHVIDVLAPHFHVVAPNCRGFHGSDKSAPRAAYTPQALCCDVLALLQHYGAERCALVGHDLGGVLAWYFAARYPQHVSRMVILNAPHPNRFQWALDHDPAQRAASQYIGRLRAPGCELRLGADHMEALWAMAFGALQARGAVSANDKAVYMQGWRAPGALAAMLNWYRAAPFVVPGLEDGYDTDRQDLIGALFVAAPTLVIWGMQDDVLLPVLLDNLVFHVGELEIFRLEGAGHGLLHEKPGPVACLVREFLLRGRE